MPPNSGWVTDPEHYYELSGFKIQAPSGSNWYAMPEEEKNRSKITFRKVEPTAIRFNAYHPEFTFSFAHAMSLPSGFPIPLSRNAEEDEKLLRRALKRVQKVGKVKISDSSYTTSPGAACMSYKGKAVQQDINTEYGTIRISDINGYLCLHPLYSDIMILLQFANGASVELTPANRDEQMEHFFKSIRFTHTDLPPSPPSSASKVN